MTTNDEEIIRKLGGCDNDTWEFGLDDWDGYNPCHSCTLKLMSLAREDERKVNPCAKHMCDTCADNCRKEGMVRVFEELDKFTTKEEKIGGLVVIEDGWLNMTKEEREELKKRLMG